MSTIAHAVSRRGFLKGAALGVIGTGVAASGALALAGEVAGSIASASASATGFGGTVTVALDVDVAAGAVVGATIEGASETPERGGKAIEVMQQAMIDGGAVDVDTVSGATITSEAVLSASKQAYNLAVNGTEEAAVSSAALMAPGTYTGYSKSGYWEIVDLPVTVTVNEGAILKIETPAERMEHGETEVILDNVKDLWFPRVLEHQSIAVDAVAGATQTCAGARRAIKQALQQAIEAAGNDPALVSVFEQPVDLAVCAGNEPEVIDTDVLVVGLGQGGIIALSVACEQIHERNGHGMVNVLGIDSAGKVGGKSAMTHEAFVVNPQRYIEEMHNGVEYADKEHVRATMQADATTDGVMRAKEDLIDLMVDNSGDTLDWLYEHGWRYGNFRDDNSASTLERGSDKTGFNQILTTNVDPGTYEDRRFAVNKLYKSLLSNVEALGGKVMVETQGYDLITDGNKVTGVKARNVVTGQEYVINAKAVIMNTGGFSSNDEMMNTLLDERYHGRYKKLTFGQDTGLMLQAALNAGAGTFNIGMTPIAMHAGTDHWISKYPFETMTDHLQARTGRYEVVSLNNIPLAIGGMRDAIYVDRNAQRWINEPTYAILNHWVQGPCFYSIVGNEQLQTIANEGFVNLGLLDGYNTQGKVPKEVPVPEVYECLDYCVEEGIAFKGDTIAELAGAMGLDPAALEETVTRYNGFCETGTDEEFGKDPAYLTPLATPPFYAVQMFTATFGTIGGLDVDTRLRVLKQDGQTPMDGLYAIGLDSMGVLHNPEGGYYGGGLAQGWLQTGGRLAGLDAVDYVEQAYGFAEVSPVRYLDIPSSF